MEPLLPDDILRLICDELGARRDFGTLFACSTVSTNLADAAVATMYRHQHAAQSKDEANIGTVSLADQELVTQRWSIQWRTIIKSCLGQSLIKYVQYIRALDLRDLENLFSDTFFRGRVSDNFFSEPLGFLRVMHGAQVTTREGLKRPPRLDVNATLAAVGDLITQHAPQIEVISGPLTSKSLIQWIPRVPKLKSLEIFDGHALAAKTTGDLIKQHCPNFVSLRYYLWPSEESDESLSIFFTSLPEHTLQVLITHSISGMGPKSCAALNQHATSLKELRLVIKSDALPYLSLLSDCMLLEQLELEDSDSTINLEESHKEQFLQIQTWLRGCKRLRTLELRDLVFSGSLLAPVLADESIKLQRLDVSSYAIKDRNEFHSALVHQPSLQQLILFGEPIEIRDDLDALSSALTALPNLRLLKLINVSQHFAERHVDALIKNNVLLEELYIGGQFDDSSLLKLSQLPNVRTLTLSGITTFSYDAFTTFVEKLGPGNKGLSLIIDNADPNTGLSTDEQASIREKIGFEIGGQFVYEYFRDPEELEFEADSD